MVTGSLGVILSGANADGADGLRAIAAAGGITAVQSLECAEMIAMPAAALQAVPGASRSMRHRWATCCGCTEKSRRMKNER